MGDGLIGAHDLDHPTSYTYLNRNSLHRVKAKRLSKRKGTNNSSQVASQDSTALEDSPRPVKKARLETRRQIQDSRPHVNEKFSKPSAPQRNPQVISSLFTSNPSINVPEDRPLPRRAAQPSNAPLMDKSTFLGLGLDPLIVRHLETKMNVSKPTSIQREALPALMTTPGDQPERDVFIQSQTGSGKTLSYLLPILNDLLPLSSQSYIDRSIGTLAIIIAPTRELAKQISDVLEALLTLRLRPPDEDAEDESNSTRLMTRWLVSGLLIGGTTRTHEKARLRKGLPILVSTPGRLLDHLQNTASFNVGKCRWLVLDEADRLMELGFEESIKGILQALDGRRKLTVQAVEEGNSLEVGGWDWERRRRTILCSATIREDVQLLAGTALINPIVVKPLEKDDVQGFSISSLAVNADVAGPLAMEKFTPPSQLLQKYVVVPLKLRLVALVALLRSLLATTQNRKGTKIIVFLSCTDSVDYHWKLLGSSAMDSSEDEGSEHDSDDQESEEDEGAAPERPKLEKVSLTSPLLPDTTIYRLHGSLPMQTRLVSLKGFSKSPKDNNDTPASSILLCTSVASRGLDLPLVRAVVQYDLPTEGGATEYVHRVGRTARVGKGGEAWSFISPSEQEWVPWISERIQDKSSLEKKASLVQTSVESVLQSGFGGKSNEFEERATQVQLSFERWVLKKREVCHLLFHLTFRLICTCQNGELARKAFQSHVRAYATHPSDEKHMFHIRNLHIGHLAKAFALRDAPGNMSQKTGQGKRSGSGKARPAGDKTSRGSHKPGHNLEHDASAESRMQDVVRKQGRLIKKGGVMMSTGTSEFQIAGGYDLEKLVNQH